jgi:hypothetical protein
MFNLQRFLLLANAHWTEYRKAYAWFIGIGIMLHFVLLLIIFSGSNGFNALSTVGQGVIYYCGLFLTAPIFAARYFQKMSKRESALIILMRPVSAFEKWLLAFVIVAILYPLVYSLAFYICNTPGWLLARAQAEQYLLLNPQLNGDTANSLYYSPQRYELFFIFGSFKRWQDFAQIVLILTSLQAFAVLGSLYFKAMPFIKTILFAFFILLASILVGVVFNSNPDAFFQFWEAHRFMREPRHYFYLFTWLAVPGLLWLSSYLALKEREVA